MYPRRIPLYADWHHTPLAVSSIRYAPWNLRVAQPPPASSVWVERRETFLDRQGPDILDLLAREGPRLHALLVRLTLRHDVAEELMQDLFIKLTRSHGFAVAADPAAYACRAATNLALDWRRSRDRRPALSLTDEPADRQPSTLTRLVDAEQTQRILDALSRLPRTAREAFVMRWIQQKPYPDIAPCLHRTPHQVRALCHKALRQLRAWLAGDPDSPRPKEDCRVEP